MTIKFCNISALNLHCWFLCSLSYISFHSGEHSLLNFAHGQIFMWTCFWCISYRGLLFQVVAGSDNVWNACWISPLLLGWSNNNMQKGNILWVSIRSLWSVNLPFPISVVSSACFVVKRSILYASYTILTFCVYTIYRFWFRLSIGKIIWNSQMMQNLLLWQRTWFVDCSATQSTDLVLEGQERSR